MPKLVRVVNRTRDAVLAERAELANNPWSRFWGLMGRASVAPGTGLVLKPGGGIHMFWMNFAIDALFLDRAERVVRVYRRLGEWRIVPLVWGAHSVVELPAGSLDGLDLPKGHQLQFVQS